MFSQLIGSGGSLWWAFTVWERSVTAEKVCKIISEQQLWSLQSKCVKLKLFQCLLLCSIQCCSLWLDGSLTFEGSHCKKRHYQSQLKFRFKNMCQEKRMSCLNPCHIFASLQLFPYHLLQLTFQSCPILLHKWLQTPCSTLAQHSSSLVFHLSLAYVHTGSIVHREAFPITWQ